MELRTDYILELLEERAAESEPEECAYILTAHNEIVRLATALSYAENHITSGFAD